MRRVFLLHGGTVPHYRIPIYNYLGRHLPADGFELIVASSGIQPKNPHPIEFEYVQVRPSAWDIARHIYRLKVDIVILFVDMRHLYLFPIYSVAKVLGLRLVWWGQGRDLADQSAVLKNAAYTLEHALCDSIILYAEHLKKYVAPRFHGKLFIANNTLVLDYPGLPTDRKTAVLAAYGILTRKNIICVGRFQKRKRIHHLVSAVARMDRTDVGLILVGPDNEGVLDEIKGEHVYKLGPIYGTQCFDLMAAADVYCLPGAVGLSIVDAFHCGLPFVTEDGDESAEIMYLKDGENGFVVRPGDSAELAAKLQLLLDDDALRSRFSEAAKRQVAVHGSIEQFCAGFASALRFADARSGARS